MRILYIAPLVVGFEDLLSGKIDSRGLPSFVFPLKGLLAVGHNVDIVLITDHSMKINIKVDWIQKRNIIAIIDNNISHAKWMLRQWNRLKSLFELITLLWERVKEYDFVYCHGTAALPGNIIANIKKVKCAYRLYGVEDLYYLIQSEGVFITSIKRFKYFLIFNLIKEFMLITNDGSNGDYVYEQLCRKKKYPLYFWLNGVDQYNDIEATIQVPSNKYLFNAARVTVKKGQHNAIKVLKLLHVRGHYYHLYFAGHTSDTGYYNQLKEQIINSGLDEFVHFMGAIKREDMQKMATNAIATVLFADPIKHSNQGNVFFECLSAGARIVTYREPSLEEYIDTGKNGFFADSNQEAVDIICQLEEMTPEEIRKIKENAMKTAKSSLLTWAERVRNERYLVESIRK